MSLFGIIIRKVPYLNSILERKRTKKKFKIEVNLYDNKDFQVSSTKKSYLHFSLNKAATQYIKDILSLIAAENNLVPVNLHGYAFASEQPYLDKLTTKELERYYHVFRSKGFIYSVFGGYIENIPQFGLYNVLLSIRDPRDILVSSYYSMAFSHAIPLKSSNKRDDFLERREIVKKQSVDEFVITESDKLLNVYTRYIEGLTSRNSVTILKYEDMIFDFDSWLDKLIESGGFSISAELRNQIVSEFNQTRVEKEDKTKHLRKGVAGDYLEKLKPETIHNLNNKFDEVLKTFNYD